MFSCTTPVARLPPAHPLPLVGRCSRSPPTVNSSPSSPEQTQTATPPRGNAGRHTSHSSINRPTTCVTSQERQIPTQRTNDQRVEPAPLSLPCGNADLSMSSNARLTSALHLQSSPGAGRHARTQALQRASIRDAKRPPPTKKRGASKKYMSFLATNGRTPTRRCHLHRRGYTTVTTFGHHLRPRRRWG